MLHGSSFFHTEDLKRMFFDKEKERDWTAGLRLGSHENGTEGARTWNVILRGAHTAMDRNKVSLLPPRDIKLSTLILQFLHESYIIRSVLFHVTAHFSEPSNFRNGIERLSSFSRENL